jgi:hypothetical protein
MHAGSGDQIEIVRVKIWHVKTALLADTQPQSLEELGYLRDSVMPGVMENAAFAINHDDQRGHLVLVSKLP